MACTIRHLLHGQYLFIKTNIHFAYGYFSFCLISCNMDILKNRINIFSAETSFCQFSNMASSGLPYAIQYIYSTNVSFPSCHKAITSAINKLYRWCSVLPTTITLMKAITSAKHITWVITSAHMIPNRPKLNRQ